MKHGCRSHVPNSLTYKKGPFLTCFFYLSYPEHASIAGIKVLYLLFSDDQIASLYEAAARHQPNNEDILSCLFMAHVRLGNYQQQQRTAMMLHKIRPNKNPYYFWAVMSIVMQVSGQFVECPCVMRAESQRLSVLV